MSLQYSGARIIGTKIRENFVPIKQNVWISKDQIVWAVMAVHTAYICVCDCNCVCGQMGICGLIHIKWWQTSKETIADAQCELTLKPLLKGYLGF